MACCGCTSMSRTSIVVLASVAAALLVLGVGFIGVRDPVLARIMRANLPIVNGTMLFPNWQDLPVPIITSVYIFNVTNAEAVKAGAKPELVEVGPYVFTEQHHKTDLKWNENGTLTYKQIRTWHFDENSTGPELSLDDFFVILNPPAATINSMAAKANPFIQFSINLALDVMKEELFVRRSVRQMLFDGYSDPLLNASEKLPDSLVPQKMDKFGYFYPRNGSDWYDGVFNMYTGADDLSKLGQIVAWNYSGNSMYPSPCGRVEGAGDFFPPGQVDTTSIKLYSNDLCRALVFDYDSEASVHGVHGHRYKISSSFFANKTMHHANACFNPENEVPSGVLNGSLCHFGAPIFTSQPHFYQADPIFLEGVASGLKPDQDLHETSIVVNPTSGMPVEVVARFQVNFLIEPLSSVSMFKHLRKTFFPTIWFESKVTLPESLLAQVWVLSSLTSILAVMGSVLAGVGLSMLVVGAVFLVARRYRTHEPVIMDSNLLSEEDEEQ